MGTQCEGMKASLDETYMMYWPPLFSLTTLNVCDFRNDSCMDRVTYALLLVGYPHRHSIPAKVWKIADKKQGILIIWQVILQCKYIQATTSSLTHSRILKATTRIEVGASSDWEYRHLIRNVSVPLVSASKGIDEPVTGSQPLVLRSDSVNCHRTDEIDIRSKSRSPYRKVGEGKREVC